jgi:hypothetical protein
MRMRFRFAVVSLGLAACCAATPGAPQQAPPAEKSAPTESRKKEDAMAQALGHVRLLADRIGELRDNGAKTRALVSLGGTLCNYDKGFAQAIFLQANESLKLVAQDEEEDKVRNPSKRPRFSAANDLRSQLITTAAQCDAELAARLRASGEAEKSAGDNDTAPDLNAAMRLLDEKKAEAMQLASRAMEGQPGDRTFQDFSMFLLRLRRQDPAAADQLFLAALGNLRAQPKPSSYQLMALGNYLFSSFDVTKRPELADGITFVLVGGVSVISLQFSRPGNSPQTVRTYLEASLDMLSRPSTDARLQQLDYAAAYQLLPKARETAPDLVPAFDLAMMRLNPSVPDRMKQGAQNSDLSRLSQPFARSDEENESDLASSTNPQKRQTLLYQLASSALRKGDYARARKFAADLENKEFRAQFLSLIDFGEAGKAADDGHLEAVLAAVKSLPAGVQRGLMLANIAAAQIKKGETKTGIALLDAAQREAEQVSTSLRPTFLVALISVLARADRDAALQLLTQAVAAFNERDKIEKPGDNTIRIMGARSDNAAEATLRSNSTGFFMILSFGQSGSSSPLRAKGIESYDLNARLLRLFSADAERAEAIVSQLQDEARLGPALAALAAAYLDAAEIKPAKIAEKQ